MLCRWLAFIRAESWTVPSVEVFFSLRAISLIWAVSSPQSLWPQPRSFLGRQYTAHMDPSSRADIKPIALASPLSLAKGEKKVTGKIAFLFCFLADLNNNVTCQTTHFTVRLIFSLLASSKFTIVSHYNFVSNIRQSTAAFYYSWTNLRGTFTRFTVCKHQWPFREPQLPL